MDFINIRFLQRLFLIGNMKSQKIPIFHVEFFGLTI
jgi:hypothetical protein